MLDEFGTLRFVLIKNLTFWVKVSTSFLLQFWSWELELRIYLGWVFFVKKILQLLKFCLGKTEGMVKLLLYFISMKIRNVYDSSDIKAFLNQ